MILNLINGILVMLIHLFFKTHHIFIFSRAFIIPILQ